MLPRDLHRKPLLTRYLRRRGASALAGGSASDLENKLAEYRLTNYIKNNGGGNKADSITIPKTTSLTKCPAFSATNATANFTVTNICE